MAAFDKIMLAKRLERFGWTYHPDHPDDYRHMVPPPGLFRLKPDFHVADAAQLQEMFTDWSRFNDDDDATMLVMQQLIDRRTSQE